MPEFLVVRSSAIYDFSNIRVSPHSKGVFGGFAELTLVTGIFLQEMVHLQTSLCIWPPDSARRRNRRFPGDQPQEGSYGSHDPAKWDVGMIGTHKARSAEHKSGLPDLAQAIHVNIRPSNRRLVWISSE